MRAAMAPRRPHSLLPAGSVWATECTLEPRDLQGPPQNEACFCCSQPMVATGVGPGSGGQSRPSLYGVAQPVSHVANGPKEHGSRGKGLSQGEAHVPALPQSPITPSDQRRAPSAPDRSAPPSAAASALGSWERE